MKKITHSLLLLFSLLTAGLSAQTDPIPNGDFQLWDSINGYENPRDWSTLNDFSSLFGVLTCQRGVINGTNDSYMMLVSDSVFGTLVLPGVAFCGTIDTTENALGFPYTKRPTALTGKWQYMAQGDDHGFIGAYFTKWNGGANKRDTVGIGFEQLQGMVMGWETFSIPIMYTSLDNPDSCLIFASSSGDSALQYSYLYLNDLAFDLGSGIAEYQQQHFKIFPNPSADKIQLDLAELKDIRSIELVDIHGKQLDVKAVDLNTQFIDVSGLSRGMYFIRVKTKNSVVTEKFDKQ